MHEQDIKELAEAIAEFVASLESANPIVRENAWKDIEKLSAGIGPVCDHMASDDKGLAKNSARLLELAVHRAARPGNAEDAQAVADELVKVAESTRPIRIRANAVHLLGFVGDVRVVPALSKLLTVPEIQEEARLAIERIPGAASVNVLKTASKTATPKFKPNLEQSIRNRTLNEKTVGLK